MSRYCNILASSPDVSRYTQTGQLPDSVTTTLVSVCGTMLIGYARTSTTDQIAGLEAQERDLLAQGYERLWREQTSALGPRNALEEAISFARSGDSLVVTKICRLARSVSDLVAIIDRLEKKGVSLRILSMGIDTATPTGRLMLNLLAHPIHRGL
jgi:DNA invertase Pin-like site-specific DNA recombinase